MSNATTIATLAGELPAIETESYEARQHKVDTTTDLEGALQRRRPLPATQNES
jgi:hypothetical protein